MWTRGVKKTIVGLFVIVTCIVFGGISASAEDFSLQHEEITGTSEAQLIVREGDIDNLGFGWPAGFDPFSGNSTPPHGFPWTLDPSDTEGTDRIMVVSSYVGTPPNGNDGYTNTTSRPDNDPLAVEMTFTPIGPVSSAILQMFVDDFQAPVWDSVFQATLNGTRVPVLESILNSLNQTGPIGKLISFQLPPNVVSTLSSGSLEIFVDDPVTGAGDGFAFDFFRLLINPGVLPQTGTIEGTVRDSVTFAPIPGAKVSAGGIIDAFTDPNGEYFLNDVPAGLAAVTASKPGYEPQTLTVDLISGETATLDFLLVESEEEPCEYPDADGDGVIDPWDKCPDTPPNSAVFSDGCPAPVTPGCTEAELDAKYEEGFAAGKESCEDDPEPGGEGNCATFNFIENKLHVPCLDAGRFTYWLDLELKGADPVILEMTDFGQVEDKED